MGCWLFSSDWRIHYPCLPGGKATYTIKLNHILGVLALCIEGWCLSLPVQPSCPPQPLRARVCLQLSAQQSRCVAGPFAPVSTMWSPHQLLSRIPPPPPPPIFVSQPCLLFTLVGCRLPSVIALWVPREHVPGTGLDTHLFAPQCPDRQ